MSPFLLPCLPLSSSQDLPRCSASVASLCTKERKRVTLRASKSDNFTNLLCTLCELQSTGSCFSFCKGKPLSTHATVTKRYQHRDWWSKSQTTQLPLLLLWLRESVSHVGKESWVMQLPSKYEEAGLCLRHLLVFFFCRN